MERRLCIDGTLRLTSMQKQVHCFFLWPKIPTNTMRRISDPWIASACLSSHLPHIYSIPTINKYTVCPPPVSRNQLANGSPSRVQMKTSDMASSHLVYLLVDNESQGKQEKLLVQANNRETRKASLTKVQPNVSQQVYRMHRMEIMEDDERETVQVRCVLPAFSFLNASYF